MLKTGRLDNAERLDVISILLIGVVVVLKIIKHNPMNPRNFWEVIIVKS